MNRRDRLLKLIVEHFIKTAQPVGSKTLVEEYHLDYASSTIRSEMNALEADGYLEKPHTSSGRVPSSKGYRYYIENLREKSVDEEFKYQMQTILEEKVQSINDVIKQSCEILSQMTSLASVVLGPNANEEKLVSVQLIPISKTSATCVFVTDQGYVENKTFFIDKDYVLDDIKSCVVLLNDRLKGTAIAQLVDKMESIRPLLSDYVIDHDVIYQALLEAFAKFAKERLASFGKEELLKQPEFINDTNKIHQILEMLNNPEMFRNNNDSNELISVHIGGENEMDNNFSLISAKVNINGDKQESIAVLGPKRMDYDRVVSSLEYLIKELQKKYGKEKDDNERKEKRD